MAAVDPSQALAITLTSESLVFATLGVSLSLTGSVIARRSVLRALRHVVVGVVAVLTALAVGAAAAWTAAFPQQWPSDLSLQIVAICLAVAIVGQPLLAWALAWLIVRRPAQP